MPGEFEGKVVDYRIILFLGLVNQMSSDGCLVGVIMQISNAC